VINLDPQFKYGIMLSGGLDSAVLLYLILKENKNISIQPFSIPKHDNSHMFVPGILEYFKDQFDTNISDTILVGDPNVHHSQQSTIAIKQIFKDYSEIDFVYFATNQNPTYDFDYNQYPKGSYPDRVKASPHPKILMPFIEMYKDEILKIVFDNNQEEILLITHSCTEQKTGRCGQCFQCNERAWAFCQLNKTDPGIN
jgi:7-cyano-7-deazaguanine synthase in queuosine biosynthesis